MCSLRGLGQPPKAQESFWKFLCSVRVMQTVDSGLVLPGWKGHRECELKTWLDLELPDGDMAMLENSSNWLVTLTVPNIGQKVTANQIPLPPPITTSVLTHGAQNPMTQRTKQGKGKIWKWALKQLILYEDDSILEYFIRQTKLVPVSK